MPSVEVRKAVTVLFSDVTGFTALGERLDPESLRQVMTRYFDEMRSVVERHGGTVEKYIGDAVMAIFGVPVLHEDDALRAVRAAAEMRTALSELNSELVRTWGARLEIRTGVNTGEVVAGDASGDHALVTGDAVNVAARLEQAAQPGEILLGEQTFRLVRDAVDVEPVEPLELKGKGEPVVAHRLRRVTPGVAGVARRLDSPLVGRDVELAAIRTAFEEAAADRLCRLVTVVGEAGSGKSRLVAEFTAATSATVLIGRCLSYGEGITFWPIAEALKSFTGITEQDSPEDARSRIGGLLAGAEDADLVRDRVVSAMGLGGSGGELQETFWAIRRLLEAVAAERPVVLLLEDIHWAEPTLLDLLDYVAGFSGNRAILLLCTARPELGELRPDWQAATTTVSLRPLTEDQSGKLIENLLGRAGLADEARARITEAAEGNPLFVEEMLRMLIDDGLLVRDNGHWRQEGNLTRATIPPTIHALLSARLDRLDSEERSVIQCASVVGKVFYWGAVASLSSDEARPRVGPHLQTLIRKELVRPESSSFAGEDAFRFSHILVRDAAYESVPKRIRAELHERFAEWLGKKAGQRIAEYEEILGYHLEQAYRYRAALGPVDPSGRGLAQRASGHLGSSGRRAFRRGDMSASMNLLERAVELLPEDDPARPELLASLADALYEVGEWEDADRALAEVIESAAASGDQRLEWRARVQMAHLRAATDPRSIWTDYLEEAEGAIEVLQELEDDVGLARAWTLVADMQNGLARRREMEEAAVRAVEHARRAGDPREEAQSARMLGGALVYGPTPVSEAIPRCEEILRGAEGSPMLKAAILPILGHLYGFQGRFPEARALFDQARRLQQELGLRFFSARMALAVGDVELFAGNPAAAEEAARRGCEIFKEMGETGRFSTLAALLADALYSLERDDEAYAFTEESEETTSPDDVVSRVDWRRVRAKVLARRGELARAEELIGEALRLAEDSVDDVHLHAKVRRDAAEVLRLSGRASEAVPHLEQALAIEERKGIVAGAARERAVLEGLKGERH